MKMLAAGNPGPVIALPPKAKPDGLMTVVVPPVVPMTGVVPPTIPNGLIALLIIIKNSFSFRPFLLFSLFLRFGHFANFLILIILVVILLITLFALFIEWLTRSDTVYIISNGIYNQYVRSQRDVIWRAIHRGECGVHQG